MAAPRRITIDLDPTDDPTHGQQQFTFFNSHYDSYCYLPMVGLSHLQRRGGTVFWLPPCCARVMFPAPAVRSAFCAACFGVWIPRFPERSSACAWMGGLRRRSSGVSRPPASCGICREPGLPMRCWIVWPSRPCVPFARLSKKSGETGTRLWRVPLQDEEDLEVRASHPL